MIKTNCVGRLGNNIIRNLAVSRIAEKYDLKVEYSYKDLIDNLGIFLFSGNNGYEEYQELNDNNYFSLYNCGDLKKKLNPNNSYFQTKEISNFLYEHLQSDVVKFKVIEKNQFKERYNSNNDLLIHIRLGDVSAYNAGIDYYLNTIKNITFDNLYITTDQEEHHIVRNIFETYPNLNLIKYDEILTFQFASTCKNIVLSHGSFSAIIGYLSFFSNVYYPKYELGKIWYGDMFSIKNWIEMG